MVVEWWNNAVHKSDAVSLMQSFHPLLVDLLLNLPHGGNATHTLFCGCTDLNVVFGDR